MKHGTGTDQGARYRGDVSKFTPSGPPRNLDRSKVAVPKAQVEEFAPATGTKIDQTKRTPTEATQSRRAALKAPNGPINH